MTAPAGAVVGLYVDLIARIAIGDVIQTEAGRRYQVLAARTQRRGQKVGRQHLRVVVLGEADPVTVFDPARPPRTHVIRWYKRGRRGARPQR